MFINKRIVSNGFVDAFLNKTANLPFITIGVVKLPPTHIPPFGVFGTFVVIESRGGKIGKFNAFKLHKYNFTGTFWLGALVFL